MSARSAVPGVFPQDEQWGMNESVYSNEIGKQRVWLSGVLPYTQCEQVFARIGERLIPASSIWRQSQRHRQRLQTYVEQQRTHGDLAGYFERHQRRMQYLEFREEGFPIGSDTVESWCQAVQTAFDRYRDALGG